MCIRRFCVCSLVTLVVLCVFHLLRFVCASNSLLHVVTNERNDVESHGPLRAHLSDLLHDLLLVWFELAQPLLVSRRHPGAPEHRVGRSKRPRESRKVPPEQRA